LPKTPQGKGQRAWEVGYSGHKGGRECRLLEADTASFQGGGVMKHASKPKPKIRYLHCDVCGKKNIPTTLTDEEAYRRDWTYVCDSCEDDVMR